MKIVVATHNENKLREMREVIISETGLSDSDFELVSAGSLQLPDVKETGVTFEENALIKAQDVARRTGLPAVADDSGLIVEILGKAPGILSARWAGKHGDDKANIDLLLAQLEDIPDENRGAYFRCAVALVIPDAQGGFINKIHIGDMHGTIVRQRKGSNGFGYDPIFVPTEQEGTRTSAQLSAQEKNAISHRGKALRMLVKDIRELCA
ncbi:MAG: RdgB/HAM1 family non-canonical purine NTP pyrophosphatase [Bifidobacteriaceae bacterium]|nr:RdgB/HAM1 family non-canonical purine NTP pyrophosphatase [Bifidobacteriaceae bacterium]